jgi:hypothetical protein
MKSECCGMEFTLRDCALPLGHDGVHVDLKTGEEFKENWDTDKTWTVAHFKEGEMPTELLPSA